METNQSLPPGFKEWQELYQKLVADGHKDKSEIVWSVKKIAIPQYVEAENDRLKTDFIQRYTLDFIRAKSVDELLSDQLSSQELLKLCRAIEESKLLENNVVGDFIVLYEKVKKLAYKTLDTETRIAR